MKNRISGFKVWPSITVARASAILVLAAAAIATTATGCAARDERPPQSDSNPPAASPDRPAGAGAPSPAVDGIHASNAEPLTIGQSFTLDSHILGEVRRINVYRPTIYGEPPAGPLPVLYMLDGGLHEDFLHIAGLVQVLVSNGGMRPALLVGVENTQRRRNLTGPTSNPDNLKIAPVVGGSAAFRRFVRDELIPAVRARYDVSDRRALIGESLAGLFVLETFFLDRDLFDTYIAIDPSLWWADGELVRLAESRLTQPQTSPTADSRRPNVFLAFSNEPSLTAAAERLAGEFRLHGGEVAFHFVTLAGETHATVYHPAALIALRTVLAPP